jgi:hypothetical protein
MRLIILIDVKLILLHDRRIRNSGWLFYIVLESNQSRDSSVGIALGYGLDDQGSRARFPAGAGNFSLQHNVKNGSGAHPASYPMGTRGSFSGGKSAGREADHTSISAEVKNVWSYTSTPPYVFVAWCLVKHRDNFAFTFTFYLESNLNPASVG